MKLSYTLLMRMLLGLLIVSEAGAMPESPFPFSSVVFSCSHLNSDSFYVPVLYQWIQKSGKIRNAPQLIQILDHIAYNEKLNRLSQFCSEQKIDVVYAQDFDWVERVVNQLLFENASTMDSHRSIGEALGPWALGYPLIHDGYDPRENQPELSYAYSFKDAKKEVFFVKTRKAPLQWQEVCLAGGVTELGQFRDCFESGKTRMRLHFRSTGDAFQVEQNLKCLSKAKTLAWVDCDAADSAQYFKRVFGVNKSGDSYLNFRIQHPLSGQFLFNGEEFHFRDAFPKIGISTPLASIPSQEDVRGFLEESEITTARQPDLYLIWLDTLRADVVSPSVMPNLYAFAQENLSFKKTFAGATATRPAGFTLWNSRPATEWKYFDVNGYGRSGSMNLNLLRKIGYDVHAFASILPVIDEGLFNDYGAFFNYGENFFTGESPDLNGRVFFHRDVFDFKRPVEKRTLNREQSLAIEDYQRLSPLELDEKVVEFFLQEIESPRKQDAMASFVWLTGSHLPYLPIEEGKFPEKLRRSPAFRPYPQDPFSSVKKPLWEDWFFDCQGRGTGLKNPLSLIQSYLNSTVSIDSLLGKILSGIKKAGKYEDSLIVIMGDHGESLFENGYVGHGGPTLQKVIEVPIVYKFPHTAFAKKKLLELKAQVGTQMDIFPSIFDYMGLEWKQSAQQKRKDSFFKGTSIFESQKDCQISSEPNGYSYNAIEFSMFNGKEKLRARFQKKEKTPDTYDPDENPLASNFIEPISFTDYEDIPLNAGYGMEEIAKKLNEKFGSCFLQFFGEASATDPNSSSNRR